MKRLGNILLIIGIMLTICIAFVFADESKKVPLKKKTIAKSMVKKWRDIFKVNKKNLGPTGENTYFILQPGYKQIYKADNTTDTSTVLDATTTIDSVAVRVVEDREEKNGQAVELTKDYYAIDTITKDVYYFGEDAEQYKDGKEVGHSGSWLSGVNGAKFGLMMPGKIKVGSKFYQEIAPKIAMDRAEIKQTGLKVKVPAGTFENCIFVEETTPLEPDVKDYKWYAPGIGVLKDNELGLIKTSYP